MVRDALYEIMPKTATDRFETKEGADFAYTMGDRGRFRVNVIAASERHGRSVSRHPVKALTIGRAETAEAVRQDVPLQPKA